LHVVPVLVNGVAKEEALLDNGSQIVSMTQECYNSDSKPNLSPAFKGLLDNLRDYNAT